jgi:hypothetical protein
MEYEEEGAKVNTFLTRERIRPHGLKRIFRQESPSRTRRARDVYLRYRDIHRRGEGYNADTLNHDCNIHLTVPKKIRIGGKHTHKAFYYH